jgi:hypothetical protein
MVLEVRAMLNPENRENLPNLENFANPANQANPGMSRSLSAPSARDGDCHHERRCAEH